MKIDLHVHTSPRSKCSYIDPMELLEEAKSVGLDGLCLTEHQVVWPKEEVEELSARSGLRIFRGNEITTNQGDVLVFGYYQDVQGIVPIEELRREVERAGGLMIAAHPFRGFLLFGISQLHMDVEQASKRAIFRYVDAVEIGNCKVTDQENAMAQKVAQKLGLPGVAGSDAHRLEELGRFVTIFQGPIHTEEELLRELRAGSFNVGSARP